MKEIIRRYEERRKHITLVREPNNTYDRNAVSVRVKVEGGLVYNTKKFYDIGYLPSYISKEVKEMSIYLTSAVEDGKGMVVGVFFSQLPFGQPVKVPKQIIRKPFKPLSLAQIRRKFGE